ncbi:MAG: hypothetical protein M3125_01630 [Gemmatimonadota bacterium]|nr:hypothetical protein [Gemmatimonadota bacterium]
MKDHDDEDLMRAAHRTYHVPPEPPLEEMWRSIEARRVGTAGRTGWYRTGIALAASLVLGVGLGRYVVPAARDANRVPPSISVAARDVMPATEAFVPGIPYEVATRRYLGQTAALLIALPSAIRPGGTDARFAAQAQELLSTTRLLLDSPAAADSTMRGLLEDLELVLAQIARVRSTQREAELDFITSTLEQRDVLPRLGSVAADVASSDN